MRGAYQCNRTPGEGATLVFWAALLVGILLGGGCFVLTAAYRAAGTAAGYGLKRALMALAGLTAGPGQGQPWVFEHSVGLAGRLVSCAALIAFVLLALLDPGRAAAGLCGGIAFTALSWASGTLRGAGVRLTRTFSHRIGYEVVAALSDGFGVAWLSVDSSHPLANQTLAEAALKRRDVLVLAIDRNGLVLQDPRGPARILPGDRLLLYGPVRKAMLFAEGRGD